MMKLYLTRKPPVIVLYQNGFWPNKLSAMINGISKIELPDVYLIEYEAPEDIFQQLEPVLKMNITLS